MASAHLTCSQRLSRPVPVARQACPWAVPRIAEGGRTCVSPLALATPTQRHNTATQPCRVAPQRSIRHVVCRASSSDSEPWPFHDSDFHKVAFVPPPYGPMKLYEDSRGGTFNGVLVFKRDSDVLSNDDLNVLEVFVAGDTAFNTWSLLTHRLGDRPMVHELMWTLLERAHGEQARDWALLRVAIVELRDNVFIGRLFFGDQETGEVKWDCDCRPSDGCYLSLRAHCPFYVHRRVWDAASLPIRNSSVYKLVAGNAQRANTMTTSASGSSASTLEPQNTPYYRSGTPGGSGAVEAFGGGGDSGHGNSGNSSSGNGREEEWQGKAANPNATADTLGFEEVALLRPDDPDAIKLLKRQLAVAVGEENYAEAIRIRDHAWMCMYRDIHTLRLQGRYDRAHSIEQELRRQISAVAEAST